MAKVRLPPLSRRVYGVEYAIREIEALATELQEKGRDVIKLNIGDPLRYGFRPPAHILREAVKALEENHNYYAPSLGLEELREAVARKEAAVNGVRVGPRDVIITQGVSEAINFVLACIVSPGDKVMLPSPCYPVYVSYTKFYEGVPVYYRLVAENGEWRIDVDEVRGLAEASRAKAIVVINPNNPTGALIPEADIRELASIAAENGMYVISDEIYDRITFEEGFVSTARAGRDVPVIGLNGFSKAYLATGWRLGYVYFKHTGELDEIREAVARLARVRLSAPTPFQVALARTMAGDGRFLEEFMGILRARRSFLLKRVGESGYFEMPAPKAAFYAYLRVLGRGDWGGDREFAARLLEEEGVAVVPGSGFYDYEENRFRIVFLPPEEVLDRAIGRIESFVRRHSR